MKSGWMKKKCVDTQKKCSHKKNLVFKSVHKKVEWFIWMVSFTKHTFLVAHQQIFQFFLLNQQKELASSKMLKSQIRGFESFQNIGSALEFIYLRDCVIKASAFEFWDSGVMLIERRGIIVFQNKIGKFKKSNWFETEILTQNDLFR